MSTHKYNWGNNFVVKNCRVLILNFIHTLLYLLSVAQQLCQMYTVSSTKEITWPESPFKCKITFYTLYMYYPWRNNCKIYNISSAKDPMTGIAIYVYISSLFNRRIISMTKMYICVRGIYFAPVFAIMRLDFGIGSTVWYYLFWNIIMLREYYLFRMFRPIQLV